MTLARTSNELDVQNEREENTHTQTHKPVDTSLELTMYTSNISSKVYLVSSILLGVRGMLRRSFVDAFRFF